MEFQEFKEMLHRDVKFSIHPYRGTKVLKATRLPDGSFITLLYNNSELFSRNKFRVKIAELTHRLMLDVSRKDFFDILNEILKNAEESPISITERSYWVPRFKRGKS